MEYTEPKMEILELATGDILTQSYEMPIIKLEDENKF